MLMVRAGTPAAPRRVSATLLLGRAPIVVLVDPPPLGSARGRGRHPDLADIRNGDPTACTLPGAPISSPPQPSSPAEAQEDRSDDFGRLLDEMDEILGEPTIALLIRLRWLSRDRQKDHAAVMHALCRFVGHVLDITRNGRP